MTQDAMSTPSDPTSEAAPATEGGENMQLFEPAAVGEGDRWPDEEPENEPEAARDDKPADEDRLGDSGKRALISERQARRDAEKQLNELRARLSEYEDRDKSELQRAQESAQRYEQELSSTRVANARLMAAAIHNLPPDLIDLLGDGTEEEIDTRAKLLAEKLAANTPAPAEPQASQPAATRPVESLFPGARPAYAEPEDPNAWLRRMAGRAP